MLGPFYVDRTLVAYQELVPHIDGELAEPLYLAAVILTNTTWLLSHRRERDADGPSQLPLQTYYMIRGIVTLFARRVPFLEGRGYRCFEQCEPSRKLEGMNTAEVAENWSSSRRI